MAKQEEREARETLLDVRDLRISAPAASRESSPVALVDAASISLRAGETLALVGESGSGKTLTALALVGLLPPGLVVDHGSVAFDGVDLLSLGPRNLRRLRGHGIAMVFQESASALDPLLSVGRQIGDALRRHGEEESPRERALELLRQLDVADPERMIDLRPHELSGGMAQRALLAVTLACAPRVLICDEPTRGLDAPTALSVLEALVRARPEHGAQLLISHDLDAVRLVASRIAVMHAGQLVEFLEVGTGDLQQVARHPYTRALLAARPGGKPGRRLTTLVGEAPRSGAFPAGCRFEARCPHVHARCRAEAPGWFDSSGELVAAQPGEVLNEPRWRCFGWGDGEAPTGTDDA